MKPYYEAGGISIYLGDSQEILSDLKPSADYILTDPPYGIAFQSSRRIERLRKAKIHGDDAFPMWIFEDLPYRVAMFVWCRWDNLTEIPKPKSFIAWDKGVHSMGDLNHEFGRQWEACAFYTGSEHSFTRRPADIIRAMRVSPEKMVHPNEKPIQALTPLLSCHPKGLVVDPFMGSGPSLEACKLLGFDAIGIEISEAYCEIAATRLAQDVFDFGPPPVLDSTAHENVIKTLF